MSLTESVLPSFNVSVRQQTEYKDWSHLRDLSWICFLRNKLQDAAKFGKLAYDKAPIESKGGVAKLLRSIRSEQQKK